MKPWRILEDPPGLFIDLFSADAADDAAFA